nr:V-type proton ATPase 116 kDa subunit a1-like [Lytechinus pictus]
MPNKKPAILIRPRLQAKSKTKPKKKEKRLGGLARGNDMDMPGPRGPGPGMPGPFHPSEMQPVCMMGDHLLEQDISLILDPKTTFVDADPYPFGVDPIWQLASNKINFLNSFKMKMSVILGIGQMLFGVCLSLLNHIHFKKTINIWCEFAPQLIFMVSIFGYLVFLIFYKWLFFNVHNMHGAPSLILTLINMGLMAPPDPEMFTGQYGLTHIPRS